jgi:hypothetical protein
VNCLLFEQVCSLGTGGMFERLVNNLWGEICLRFAVLLQRERVLYDERYSDLYKEARACGCRLGLV